MSKAIQQFSPIGAVLFLCMLAFVDLHAQQSVGIGTAEPNPNAILELQSDRQGILVPRLSTSQRVQMAQILQTTSGNNGMIVFDKDNGKFFYWFDNQWNEGLGALSSSTVGGDLDGSLPSPIVVGLQGRPISSASPINDQVLKWNGTAWEPSQDVGMEYQAIEGLEITGNQIKVSDDAITTQKIADEAIITDKIADNAVTLDKIAIGESSTFLSIDANGILQWEDRSNMVTSNLGTGKIFIGNHAEAAEEQTMYGHITIAFDGETTIVDNSISSSMIIDGSILAEDIADEAIINEKIADEAVTESKLADQAIGLQKIKTTGHTNAILTINRDGEAVWFSPGNNRVIITTNDGQIFTEGRNAFATSALPEGNIFVGNSEGQAYPFSARAKGRILIGNGITLSSVEVVGDINISDNGNAEIQPDAVTSDKILDGTVADADLDKANIPLSGFGAAAADVNLGSNRLTQVAEPAGPQDAATKHYVDGQVGAATDLDEGHVYIGNNTGKATAVNASAAGNILIGDGTTVNPVAVTGDISLDADGTVTISNGAVTSAKILDGTIQTADLGDASVTESKIANSAVTTSKVADGNITTAKLASNAVTSDKILDGTVADADLDKENIPLSGFGAAAADVDLGSNRLTQVAEPAGPQDAATKHYVDGQVGAATDLDEGHVYIGDNTGKATAVNASGAGNILIGDGTTVNPVPVGGDIALATDGTVTISNGAVTSAKILDGTIQTADLGDASVTEAKIANSAVTTSKVADGNITTAKLASNAVTSDKILDGTVADADLDKENIPLSGFGAAAADVDLGSNRLTQVAEPAGPQDAATKHYVDGQVGAATDLDEGHVYIGNNTGKATAVNASAAGNILIGDGTTVNPVAVTGDISLDADGTVTISNGAVTSAKILDGTIQTADLGDASVTESKIANSAVTTSKVADGNITTAKLADNAVTNIKLASNVVTSDKILDGTIADTDLDKANIPLSGFGAAATDVVLGSNRLTQVAEPAGPQDAATKHYVDGQVGAATDLDEGHVYIGDNTGKATAVNASGAGNILIGDGTTVNPVPVGGDIALATDGTVTISNGAVTSAKILDGTIQTADLGDASVTESKIANSAVTTSKVADGNITTAKLADNAVTNIKLASNVVTSDKILDGTIADTDLDKANIPLSGFGAAAADVDLGNNRLTQVAEPTGPQDAATKYYVDALFAIDGDQDDENEIQDLSLSSHILSLSLSGSTVDLSPYLDNTDSQNLGSSKTGNQVTVTIDNGTATTFDISDGDNDPTNESLTAAVLDGTDLRITESGNETIVDLSYLKDTYTAGDAIEVTGNNIAVQYDGVTIGLNASNELELMSNAVSNDKIANGTIDFSKMANSEAANGQVMVWSNALNKWTPGNATSILGLANGDITAVTTPNKSGLTGGKESGDVILSLENTGEGEILIGNGTNINTATVSGAITLSPSGSTSLNSSAVQNNHIADDAITTNKIADGAVTSEKLDAMSAIEGQVMTFKSGKWVAEDPTSVFSSSITRTAYYSVDPLDFVVLGEADANHTSYPTNPEEATYVAVENFNNGANIAAPVHLPHGATIQEVSLYYMDDESGVAVDKDISFQLTRKARRNGTNEEIASFTSSGAAAIEQEAIITTITNGSVDNSLFSYRVIVRLRGTNSYGTSKHRIYSVVIKYSETIQND